MTIKVLHSRELWLPITEIWLFNQIKYLSQDIESHIVCDRLENRDIFDLENINICRYFSIFNNQYVKRFIGPICRNRYLRKLHKIYLFNIIHSHFAWEAYRNIVFARKFAIPHVMTPYGLDVSKLPRKYPKWKSRYKKMFCYLDLVLCEGSCMAQKVMELGCSENKIRIHRLGIEVDKIECRQRQWASLETLKILIVASFREKKGIPYAIEAIGKISKEIQVEITIIGDAGNDESSQNEKKKIINKLSEYSLTSCTRMLGYQSQTRVFEEAYKNHIFISPSITACDGDDEGGLPVGLIEMAATGMPVISSYHCDIPELINHKETGLLSEEKNSDSLYNNIVWLVNNKQQWSILTNKMREHIVTNYNAKKQGDLLSVHYKNFV